MIRSKLVLRAIAEIGGLVVGAGSMIYISRIVGPEYVGYGATATAFIQLLGRLADGGLTSLASQRLAREDDSLERLLTVTLLPKLAISTVLVVLSFLALVVLPVNPTLRYFIAVNAFIIIFEACTPAWVFVALGNINISSFIRIGQSIGYALLVFCLIQRPVDWKFLPVISLASAGINFFLAGFFLYRYRYTLIDRNVFSEGYVTVLRSFYQESFHFLKADLSSYVFTTSDRLILYFFTTPQVVGIYEAAYKVINPFYAINSVITPTMFRDLAQSFKLGRLRPVMAKYVFFMCLFSIPLGFYLLFFSRFVVDLLYGQQFAASANSLMVLGFVITFGFTGGIIVLPFSAWNMSREFGNSTFWGNVVNTVFNISLIPFWGALGAAIATLAAKMIVTGIGYVYFKKTTAYPIVIDFIWFFAASILPLLVVLPLQQVVSNGFFLTGIYLLIYFVCASLLYQYRFKQVMCEEASVVEAEHA